MRPTTALGRLAAGCLAGVVIWNGLAQPTLRRVRRISLSRRLQPRYVPLEDYLKLKGELDALKQRMDAMDRRVATQPGEVRPSSRRWSWCRESPRASHGPDDRRLCTRGHRDGAGHAVRRQDPADILLTV